MKKMSWQTMGVLGVLFLAYFVLQGQVMPCQAETKLVASDAATYDFLVYSVASSGDTVVVGTPFKGNTGAAYVFRRDGAGWAQVAKLTASDATRSTLFGISVAVSGNTVVVGAPYSRTVGSAYVFACGDAGCTQVQKLTAGDGSSDDTFGTSVSLSGKTLIIGGPSNHGGVSYSGTTYLFRYDGSAWTQTEKLISSDAAPDDSFGACVSVSGSTAVAGAPDDDISRGSAYVFDLDGGALVVYVDIKPGSCSNPLNPKAKGVLPVTILGTRDFDVTAIDPATIRLSREGVGDTVSPIRESYEDVAISAQEDTFECNQSRGDGYIDLTLKFDTEELVEILRLGEVAGETLSLLLTGNLNEEFGGTPIEGRDDMTVLKTGKR